MRLKLLFIVLAFLLISCAPAQEVEPIKIGVSLTLTGFGAMWGENAQQGIDLAVEEVNAAGGINGRPIEIIYEDFKEVDLKAAATAGNKFATVDQVDIILTQWAEDTEVIWPIAAENDIVTIVMSSGSRDIAKQSPYIFKMWPSDEVIIRAKIDYALSQGKTKAALIAEQTSYFSVMQVIFEEVWEEKTGEKPFVQEIAPDATDTRTVLTKVKESGVDVLVMEVSFKSLGLLLKQADELGLDLLLIGGGTSDDPVIIDVAGEAAEGLVYADYVPAAPEFISLFSEKYGKEPGVPADHAYDTIKVLAQVMQEYGTGTDAIKQGLTAIKDFPGASGTISIDENGDRSSKEVLLKRIENGKGVVFSE